MYCPDCGKDVPNEYSFCPGCGRSMKDVVPQAQEKPKQEAYIYDRAANGMLVRIPASQHANWKKVQDQIRAGTYEPDPARVAQLTAQILGKAQHETSSTVPQESKKANRAGKAFLTIVLNLAGFLAAFVAFFLIYVVLYWIITFIGRIPLLGAIIYWPSDASWVRLVTCISSAVFGGAWLSTIIAKNAKLFCGAIIAIHIFTVVRLLIASAFTFTNLIECAVAIICAIMCFMMNKDDM